MSTSMNEVFERIKNDVIDFAQKIVQTKSMTCDEMNVAKLVKEKMEELGYDEVTIDATGNVLGRIGYGAKKILFDSHMDTVTVIDSDQSADDPYGGIIKDGKLYGRGSVDMKCPLVASIYGAYVAKEMGIPKDTSVYVSASVMEEDYDGEAVRLLLTENPIYPDWVVICEPTNMKVGVGHRGRALIEIKMAGKGCHASNPDNGINPVYLMTEVIKRVEQDAEQLKKMPGEKGSVAITNIYCSTASNNSVPQDATIIRDRRLALGETEESVGKEMDDIVVGIGASWQYSDIPGKSWTGKDFLFHSFLPAWTIEKEHPLVVGAAKAYEEVKAQPPELFRMQASTNGVTTAGLMHIPTIVFGPGDLAMAHARDEYCEIDSMLDAVKIYAVLCCL